MQQTEEKKKKRERGKIGNIMKKQQQKSKGEKEYTGTKGCKGSTGDILG